MDKIDSANNRTAPIAPLSVLVLTRDEEQNIGTCLDSIVGWADQILVIDSGSRDQTVSLCVRRGVEVIHHEYLDHRSQMEWSITSLPWRHDWLLLLDADNYVMPKLKIEIDRVLRLDDGTVHGYYNPHHHYFRNARIIGHKSKWLRLIRRSRTTIDGSELVDFRLVVNGRTGTLSGAIIESNQKELDIDFWIDKHQKFARRMAIEEILRNAGILKWSEMLRPNLLGNPDERMIWLKDRWYGMPLHVRALIFFVYRFVFCRGFMSGWNGFVYHFFEAFWFRLVVDFKISEYRSGLKSGRTSLEALVKEVGLPAMKAKRSAVATASSVAIQQERLR